MNRHGARELALHLIFAGEYTGDKGEKLLQSINEENFRSLAGEYALYSELPPESQEEYIRRAVTGVMAHLPELDGYIEKYAVGWNQVHPPPVYVRDPLPGHPRGRFGQRGPGAGQAV